MKILPVILLVGTSLYAQTPTTRKRTPPQPRDQTQINPGKGPFGLDAGMTLEQITQLVGKENLEPNLKQKYVYLAKNVPNPYSLFEAYSLLIDPKLGLVKIRAISINIDCNSFGDQLIEKFNTLETAISNNYGSGQKFDFLHAGSIWKERNDWMMGLLKEERTLVSGWDSKNATMKNKLQNISIKAIALNISTGYISLSYEFEGLNEAINRLKAEQNKSL